MNNLLFFRFYDQVKTEDSNSPGLSCVKREKFDHLPPALFIVAECDPLRDDSYGGWSFNS